MINHTKNVICAGVVVRSYKSEPIQFYKRNTGHESCPFISLLKWMDIAEPVQEYRTERRNVAVIGIRPMVSRTPDRGFQKVGLKQTVWLAGLLDGYPVKSDGCLHRQPSRFTRPAWQVCSDTEPLCPGRFSPSQEYPRPPHGRDRASRNPAPADPDC
jgi:hypothetical protein